MTEQIILQLTIVLSAAVLISLIMRFLKQPLLIGYILVGLLFGSFIASLDIAISNTLQPFSQMGLAFLLFMVGLSLNPRVIKEIGAVAFIVGIGQVLFTSIIGFFIMKALGFSNIPSLYVAVALTFSSTIIITKLLSDKGSGDTLYGKISIGFLIVQDLIAVLLMMIISSSRDLVNPASMIAAIAGNLLKGGITIIILFAFGFLILPRLLKHIAKSQETLFLFSIAWCFLVASLFYELNFSIELGALLAGVTIAISPYAIGISSKIKPLRDFFIVLFFISLGMQMQIGDFSLLLYPSIILALFVIIGNPIIVIILMGMLGYTKKTSFFVGLMVAQISEFTLILVSLGVSIGHLEPQTLSLVTLTGILCFIGSTYLITNAEKIYQKIHFYIPFYQRKRIKEALSEERECDALLFGYNRIGYSLLKSLRKVSSRSLVIDFNPETITMLKQKKIPVVYADAESSSLLEQLHLKKVKLAISTIPSQETNLLLLEKIREKNKEAILIVLAHQIKDALELYKKGADYVILPHLLGGEYASKILEQFGTQRSKYRENKEKHMQQLKERLREGHEHPRR